MISKDLITKLKGAAAGFLTGVINGFFGSGGGVIAVLMLKSICKLDDKKAHGTSVFVIMFLCIFSGFLYVSEGKINIADVIWYLPGGIIGGALGAKLLKKIKPDVLKILFGIVMIYSGIRMFF